MSNTNEREHRALQRYSLLVLALSISVLFFAMVRNFLQALLLAAVLTALFYPLYGRLRSWIGRPHVASFLTLVLIVLLVLVPLAGFATMVVNEAISISRDVVPWIEEHVEQPSQIESWVEQIPFADRLTPFRGPIIEKAGELVGRLGDFLIDSLAATTRSTAIFLLNLFVMLYAMFFFFVDGPAILERVVSYLPLKGSHQERLIERFASVTRATLKGNFLVGVLQGGLNGAAFAVIGIPGTVVWTAVMIVASFVPAVGSPVVWIPTVFYLLVVDRIWAAIGLAIWGALVVGSLDNILRPRLVGRDTRMPDLLVLLGTLGGLALFGPSGLILGPIVAALFLTVWQLYGEAFAEVLATSTELFADREDEGGDDDGDSGDR